MIRAIAFILTLLFAGPALAQGCGAANPNCVVPTAPVGDSSNRAASTAFVQSAAGAKTIFKPATAKADALTPNDSLSITAGSAILSDATARFVSTDVGKVLSIPGLGPSIETAVPVALGTGYTANTVQTLTVSGGTCSVQPSFTVLIGSGSVVWPNTIVNTGTCTVQPTNPVSVTGGGGTGATFNLSWIPLSTTIAGYTSGTQVTLAANSSKTLSNVSTTYLYGTSDTSAIQAALTSAVSAGSYNTPATLQLCGSYVVTGSGGFSINGASSNGYLSVVGVCPNTRILYAGTNNYDGWYVYGTGANTATTTIASNVSQGSMTLPLTSASGFNVGDYVLITNNLTSGGVHAEINQILGISSNTVTLASALSFDTDYTQSTSVANSALSERMSMTGLLFDCSYAAGTISGAIRAQYLVRANIQVQTRNCRTLNSAAFAGYGDYASNFDINDHGSGNSSATDGVAFDYTGASTIKVTEINGNGFGVGFSTGTSRNHIDAIMNTSQGRGIKFYGASGNWGTINASGAASGYVALAFTAGSSYNHMQYASGIGAQGGGGYAGSCLWSNGQQNTYNTIDHLSIANCPAAPISIGATDVGWSIGTIDYGANAPNTANSILESTAQVGAAVNNALQKDCLYAANFNSTADQAITIHSYSRYYELASITISNASTSLTTAAGGFYTGAAKSGVTLVASSQVYSNLSSTTPNTNGSLMFPTIVGALASTYAFNANPIYLSLSTPQGAAATADVCVNYRPL